MLDTFLGKPTWGLNYEPLGDYRDGKIVLFPTLTALQPSAYPPQLANGNPSRVELLKLLDLCKQTQAPEEKLN